MERTKAFARKFKYLSLFESSILEEYDYERICRALNDLSRKLSLPDLVNYHLDVLLNEADYFPEKSNIEQLTFLENKRFRLSLVISSQEQFEAKNKVLYSYPADVYQCAMPSGQNAKYSIFEQTKASPSVFDKAHHAEYSREGEMKAHETLHLRKFRDIIRFDGPKPEISLVLTDRSDTMDYSWEYDALSLQPTRIALSNFQIGSIQSALKILGDYAYDESSEVTLEMTRHHSHLVRWEAIQALLNIDYGKGKAQLENLIYDIHPEVRRAAVNAIKILD